MAKKKTKGSDSVEALGRAILANEDRLHEGVDFCLKHRNGKRWPEWETAAVELALGDSYFLPPCIEYARDIVGERWHELEPIIRVWLWDYDEDDHAVDYARQVIRFPWTELERYWRDRHLLDRWTPFVKSFAKYGK
jgi:hypothetical protein